MEARVLFDLEYMRRWSPMLDLRDHAGHGRRRDPHGSCVLTEVLQGVSLTHADNTRNRGVIPARYRRAGHRISAFCPGLSAKNLIIYLHCGLLALRMVVGRASVTAAGQMQVAFLALIVYAIVTMAASPHWSSSIRGMTSLQAGIRLKTALIDYYIFFVVFLFGVRTAEDAMKVIKGLLLGAVFVNLVTVLDAMGLVDIGFRVRDDGRTGGAIGESNQYAAFILLFLPGDHRGGRGGRGLKRLFWVGAAFVAAFALVTTASRGGFVGLAMACAVGAYLYRHLISYSRVAGWVLGIAGGAGGRGGAVAVWRTAGRAHDRSDRIHRRQQRFLGPQRDLGQRCSR